jgi:hypothetical protein
MSQHSDPLEPTNVQRAQWAKAALAVFTAETYSGDHPDTMDSADLETAIADLICDLLHFARFHPRMDAAEIHAHALGMFEQEIAEEANCDCGDRSWYGPYHDTQCPAGIAAEARKQERLSAGDLLEALAVLVCSLTPRKTAPVLETAGYSTDLWKAAHKNASALLKKFKR